MSSDHRNDVLNVILSHQPAHAISKMLAWWGERLPIESILLTYGGSRDEFENVNHPSKIFIQDSRLRTRDHQREFQSYTELFRSVELFLNERGSPFHYVHFIEYDHLPLVNDLNERQVERLMKECADVIGFHLHRIDGTSSPHFLYHVSNPNFAAYWAELSCRSEPEVVLSMFGSGSFWRREAFSEVALRREPFPIYMEIFLPTLAHHLGFRLRDFAEQNRFVGVLQDKTNEIAKARAEGAWTLHPVKHLWTS